MGVRVDFEVRKLPESYVTLQTEYAFEQDGDQKDAKGNIRRKMVSKQVEVRGGYLIVVRGKPGHSIRVQSLEQAKALKLLHEGATAVVPRLVNTETGEECDKNGIPLSVANVMGTSGGDSERIETDVDVSSNDSQLTMDAEDPAEATVGDAIAKLE